MILITILLISSVSSIDVEVSVQCTTCVLVNKTCYNATYLLDLDAPFRNNIVITKIGILRSENVLFYSFEPRIEDLEYYKIGFVNLDAPEKTGVINSPNYVMNFGSFDIDQDRSLVYLGGNDGIFELDTGSSQLLPYSSRGDPIESIFYKNNVYFVRYNDRGIVVKKGDYFKTILEYVPVNKFVIHKTDIIVFMNNFGLFVGRDKTVYRVSKNPFFRGLTVDLDGEVYAWWIDGIYKVIVKWNLVDSKVVKIAHLPSIGAMAFDNINNLLFTSNKALYRLVETTYNCTLN
ncbi:ommochrome-binding protein [Bombyx mori]|uniref:Ommochrome-binding protein-like n=1 Tax=Bombyx mori TaxID=7091 RepID=A0A8R1WFA0_BOMMO|nr:ommochrome-binding protein [Bombyx mori]